LRYQLDCSGEAGDLQFLVRECDAEGKACAAAPTEIADVRAQEEWIPLGSAPFAARMMAR